MKLQTFIEAKRTVEDGESVNKNGVGLGLTISNVLASLLNGDLDSQAIKVESVYGVGTKFIFEIEKNLHKRKDIKSDTHRVLADLESQPGQDMLIKKCKTSTSEGQRLEKEEENFDLQSDCDEFLGIPDLQTRLSSYASIRKLQVPWPFSNENRQEKDQENNLIIARRCTNIMDAPESAELIMFKSGSPAEVLIVDDNPFNLLVAKNMFNEFGLNITTALSGQEAIEIVTNSYKERMVFKAIFMDCQMPIMDGFETTKVLQSLMKENQLPKVSIFGWTTNTSEEDVKRCCEGGMAGHLPKPATKGDISKIVSKL